MPPINDAFVNAAVLPSTRGGAATGDNTGTTTETGEPHALQAEPGSTSPHRTLWWKWTAPETGVVRVSTSGSHVNTVIAVYDNAPFLFALRQLASNDDGGLSLVGDTYSTSVVYFSAVEGSTYHWQIGGASDADVGNIKFHWKYVPIASTEPTYVGQVDKFAFAPDLGPRFPCARTYSNVGAGIESGEPSGYSSYRDSGHFHNSIWVKWTCPPEAAGDIVAVSTEGTRATNGVSAIDAIVVIYVGSSFSDLVPVTVDDGQDNGDNNVLSGADQFTPIAVFRPTLGVQYYFQVFGYNASDVGNIVLSLVECTWGAPIQPPDRILMDYRGFPIGPSVGQQFNVRTGGVDAGPFSGRPHDSNPGADYVHEAYGYAMSDWPDADGFIGGGAVNPGVYFDTGLWHAFDLYGGDAHVRIGCKVGWVSIDVTGLAHFPNDSFPVGYLDVERGGDDPAFLRFEFDFHVTAVGDFKSKYYNVDEAYLLYEAYPGEGSLELRVLALDGRPVNVQANFVDPADPGGAVVWSRVLTGYPGEADSEDTPGSDHLTVSAESFLMVTSLSTGNLDPLSDAMPPESQASPLLGVGSYGWRAQQSGSVVFDGSRTWVRDPPWRFLRYGVRGPLDPFVPPYTDEGIPPLRQRQRDDGLAQPGAPRVASSSSNIPTSRQGSIRQGPRNTYF